MNNTLKTLIRHLERIKIDLDCCQSSIIMLEDGAPIVAHVNHGQFGTLKMVLVETPNEKTMTRIEIVKAP